MQRLIGALTLLLIACAHNAAAQGVGKIPVFVTRGGDDRVGTDYVFAVKEELRKSARFELVETFREAIFVIRILTLEPETAKGSTVAGIALTVLNERDVAFYLTQWLYVIGSSRTQEMGHSLVADVGEHVDEFLAAVAKIRSAEK